MAVKGWNWGKTQFAGDSMNFEVDGKHAFEIPLKNVSNTNASKNEGILQFRQNDDTSISLMEIRFHIPSTENEVDGAQVNIFFSLPFFYIKFKRNNIAGIL